ncbi:MauE/DoxX family redox-associated membrane protein [Streptomyces sp. NPDC047803]|uniref:MauE/DoxX family redox-associated membrane protein n=1 Tax=Streptomyces TaxID=1883 RepID=UPI00340962EC
MNAMNEHLRLICCCIASLVLAASALGKARAPRAFADAVLRMRIVPGRTAGKVAVAVPLIEAALAVAVWVPPLATWAFAAASGMTVAFTAVLASVIARGIDTSCSCFGVSAAPVGPAHLVRNAALLLAVGAGWVSALLHDSGTALFPAFPEALPGLFAAVCVSVLIIATDVLSEVFSGARPKNTRTAS